MLRTFTLSWSAVACGAGLLWAGTAGAGQIDSARYFALRTGMSESEVQARVGAPDQVSYPGDEIVERRSATLLPSVNGGTAVGLRSHAVVRTVKRWHYIPDSSETDPHITVITLRGDRVAAIERIKVFTRAPPPASDSEAQSAPRAGASDPALDQANRVLDAAREYAAIRMRLKQGRQPGNVRAAKIHRAPSGTYLTD